jgi:hypothetical protein
MVRQGNVMLLARTFFRKNINPRMELNRKALLQQNEDAGLIFVDEPKFLQGFYNNFLYPIIILITHFFVIFLRHILFTHY